MVETEIITQFVEEDVFNAMPVLLESSNIEEVKKAAALVASAFGSDLSFAEILSDNEKISHLLTSFKKNVALLVQKTWVEKSDEAVKAEALYNLDQVCSLYENSDYNKAYTLNLKLIEDIMYLMFGSQSKTSEFGEYALRIDPEFGIFVWYVNSLPDNSNWANDKYGVMVLLGMFFLSNY